MNKLNKDIEFNGDDLVKSVESFASTLPTKIEYFEWGNYGYGVIFRRSILTSDKNYISHTDDSVTFNDSFTDVFGENQNQDMTLTRNFNEIRDALIAHHKKMIVDLQKEVDILEASDTFDKYNSIVYKSN